MKRIVIVGFIFLFFTALLGFNNTVVFADYEDIENPTIADPYDGI